MAQQRYVITGFVIDEDTYDFKDTTTGNATTTESGFMSAADKLSLDDVIQAISNMYTKADTDAAIAQSTAITQGDGAFAISLETAGRLKWAKSGRVVTVTGEFTPSETIGNTTIIATGLPAPLFYVNLGGPTRSMMITASGQLQYWYPSDKSLIREDIAVTYISAT